MKRIEDYKVCMFWKCEDCDCVTEVPPTFYQNNGTPVCAECDRDMSYSHTEIEE